MMRCSCVTLMLAAALLAGCAPVPRLQPPPAAPPTSTIEATLPSSATATPTPTLPPAAPAAPKSRIAVLGNLPNARRGWGLSLDSSHKVPGVSAIVRTVLARYDAAYHVAVSRKVVYLTLDEGYENGYTARILDTLAAKSVTAAFFCTGAYIRDNPALVKRMVAEGHVVGNHTQTHPDMVKKAAAYTSYRAQITAVESAFRAATGRTLPRIIRMPSGVWSERCLAYNEYLGYRTYFWSYAYRDWETANQPDPADATARILANTHGGEILLLHAVSKTNSEILGDVIEGVREQGYSFEALPT